VKDALPLESARRIDGLTLALWDPSIATDTARPAVELPSLATRDTTSEAWGPEPRQLVVGDDTAIDELEIVTGIAGTNVTFAPEEISSPSVVSFAT
jgi:hypothetical protein